MHFIKLVVAIIFFYCACIYFTPRLSAQCTPVPVKEAVFNGNFELGYSQTPPGFTTDFTWLGMRPNYPTVSCMYGVGDRAGIVRAENFTCSGRNFVNNTYWAMTYGGGENFKDHTTGIVGRGYALFVDLNIQTESNINPGGKPIAWKQTVNIYPSQIYYFSAWVANFTAQGTPPVIQVTIIPYLASNGMIDAAGIQTLPAIGSPEGLMNWTQIYAAWTPSGIYNKVDIQMEFVNVEGGASGLDVVIDDISFINSCQNLIANKKPDFGYETKSICEGTGNITLNSNYHNPSAGTSFKWYYGDDDHQVQITGANTSTYTLNRTGTYRVCVEDPQNGCAVSAQVEINNEFDLQLSDYELCSPEAVTIDATPQPSTSPAISYSWTVPAGEPNPGNSAAITVSTGGNYSVTVTGPTYLNGVCITSASSIVNVTEGPVEKTVEVPEICESNNGTVVILDSQPGITYQVYKDNISNYISAPAQGNGNNVTLNVPSTALQTGNNIINIEARGCRTIIFTDNYNLSVRAKPVADAGRNIRVDEYQDVFLDGRGSSQGPFSYQWNSSLGAGIIHSPSNISTVVTPTVPREYYSIKVAHADFPSCYAIDEMMLSVFKDVIIPNVFSPNGDGIHDRFEIQNIDFFNNSILTVYNQWGEMVFQSIPGYPESWDGTRNGSPCTVGSYYYVLHLNEPEFPQMSGNVSILK
ncbi:MAG: gliding motility-associated C-terminal domain-containing protein [Cytophagaceae bacterium]